MKLAKILAILWTVGLVPLLPLQAGSDKNNGKSNNPVDQVQPALSAAPVAELPGKGAALITSAKNKDKELVALAVLDFVVASHPGSISSVVGALVGVLPSDAADLAAYAVKLLPNEAAGISAAAISAAPKLAKQITDAISKVLPPPPQPVNNPSDGADHGHRPPVPPGHQDGDDGTSSGDIHGRHPKDPPGHERDPKPDRDDHRHHYGSP